MLKLCKPYRTGSRCTFYRNSTTNSTIPKTYRVVHLVLLIFETWHVGGCTSQQYLLRAIWAEDLRESINKIEQNLKLKCLNLSHWAMWQPVRIRYTDNLNREPESHIYERTQPYSHASQCVYKTEPAFPCQSEHQTVPVFEELMSLPPCVVVVDYMCITIAFGGILGPQRRRWVKWKLWYGNFISLCLQHRQTMAFRTPNVSTVAH